MKSYKYVIIGGGTTAGYAAEEFAEQGIGKGDLCLISAESILPMNRPPLSKDYLVNEENDDEILIRDQSFYESRGIDIRLETSAQSVDFGKKEIGLDNGDTIGFDKLLIATGSTLKHLGVDGSDLDHIYYLRSIEQSDRIREQAEKSKSAVVVGGGYIGSETAAGLSEMGLKVTMIFPEDHLLSNFANDAIGEFFTNLYSSHGIDLEFNNSVKAFHGNGAVQEVELTSGKTIAADMVVVGIGVQPDVRLFEKTSLKIGDGIQVNEFCETGVDDVYAAGDVVEFPDNIFNKQRHVEHWEHAFEQGKHAAKVMTGTREPYIFVPYFFSDIFDLSYEYFGDQESADYSVTRGNIKNGDFSHWWFEGNRLVAAFIMSSRPDEESRKAREWIKNKAPVDRERINDESVSFKALAQQSEDFSNEPKP